MPNTHSEFFGTKPVEVTGRSARMQMLCLQAVGAVSSRFHNRGMQRFASTVGRQFFDEENTAVLKLACGGKLKIYLNDGYWAKLLIPNFVYEPDVHFVLSRALTQANVFFIDCGANIGYWSVVASRLLPPGYVVAIEASPPNYYRLQINAQLNGKKFDCVLGALWSRDGENLVIVSHEMHHAGSSVVDRRDKIGQPGYQQHTVRSVTLDSVCDQYIQNAGMKIVVKLDVEGAEIPALEGARRILNNQQPLFLYEDHGQDPACRVSEYFMDHLGFHIFYCNEKRSVRRMSLLSAIRSVKRNSFTGYNFAACAPASVFSRMLENMQKSF